MNNTAKLVLKTKAVGECWKFLGYLDSRGYGQCSFKGKRDWAHRTYYRAFVGELPKGKELDHLCRNRWCVNPKHLEPVSHKENQLRGYSFAGNKARQTHCIHGHAFTIKNTIVRKDGRRNCRECYRGK